MLFRSGSRAPRGGAISNAARRSDLGLETTNTTDPSQPKRKRGRPSNAERALRAEAEAAATAASNTFALDPQLGGPAQPGAQDLASTAVPARSPSREASVAASSIQGDRPRKRRRTAAQMEEARRLDEERQARLAAAKAAKVANSRREEADAGAAAGAEESAAVLFPAGQRSARRTRSSNAAEEVKKITHVGEGGEGDGPAADPQVEGDEKMPG